MPLTSSAMLSMLILDFHLCSFQLHLSLARPSCKKSIQP
jgi:hypothetical protein